MDGQRVDGCNCMERVDGCRVMGGQQVDGCSFMERVDGCKMMGGQRVDGCRMMGGQRVDGCICMVGGMTAEKRVDGFESWVNCRESSRWCGWAAASTLFPAAASAWISAL